MCDLLGELSADERSAQANLSPAVLLPKLSEMQHYANAAKELYITQISLSRY